jgi:hypothetical protein
LLERVAELEATTARKGNRKVSLTISGWVNEAVFAWDDGTNGTVTNTGIGETTRSASGRNVYIGTNSLEQTRVRFVGQAQIDKDWSAGYVLELGTQDNHSGQWNQFGPNSASLNPANQDGAIIIRKSNWFIKNNQLGQLAVGQNGTATYHLLDDADATQTRSIDDAEGAAVYLGAMQLRTGGSAIVNYSSTAGAAVPLKWTDALRGFNNSTPGQSGRRAGIRYDSPTIAGFTGSAFWGASDIWDVALRYKGDIGDFSILAQAGYGQSNDPGNQVNVLSTSSTPGSGNNPFSYVNSSGGTACISSSTVTASTNDKFQCSWEGAAATVQHKQTGLYVYGGWGSQTINAEFGGIPGTVNNFNPTLNKPGSLPLTVPTSTTWFIQPGIEHKWFALGKTTIFGEYRQDDAGTNPGKFTSSDINFWQAGVVQNLEAAATSLYVVYEQANGDVTSTGTNNYLGSNAAGGKGNIAPNTNLSLNAFQEVIVGAKIEF